MESESPMSTVGPILGWVMRRPPRSLLRSTSVIEATPKAVHAGTILVTDESAWSVGGRKFLAGFSAIW